MTESRKHGVEWQDVPITAGDLADVFDAFCGADGHNLVVSIMTQRALASAPPSPKHDDRTVPDASDLVRRLHAEAASCAKGCGFGNAGSILLEAAVWISAAKALAVPKHDVWQDIATVTDEIKVAGSRLLLWGKYWSDGQGFMDEPLVGQWHGQRWEVWGPGGRFGIRPTHWQPLPTPPEGT